MNLIDALELVADERERQDVKWGEQNHDPFTWITVLMEEVGELSQECLKSRFSDTDNAKEMKEELVQVAAVAVAFLQCLEREKWSWSK